MARTVRFLAALLAVAISGLPTVVTAAQSDKGISIILYHRVGDDRYPSTNVSLEAFRSQMEWLKTEGYRVVSPEEVEAFILKGRDPGPKAVAIQFDDGFRSVYENGFPVLKEYGYPFVVFVATRPIEKNFGDYVTWEMAREMAEGGGVISSHGHAHLRLGAPPEGSSSESWEEAIREEFGRCRQILREKGFDDRWIAYPYGEYGAEVMRTAREMGFSLGFAQDPGAAGAGFDPFMIPRFAVVGSASDLKTFKERLTYEPLALYNMTPAPGLLAEQPGQFGAKVVSSDDYDVNSANMFVSELGRMDAKFEKNEEALSAEWSGVLKRRLNRVLISAQNRKTGKYALRSWIIMQDVKP